MNKLISLALVYALMIASSAAQTPKLILPIGHTAEVNDAQFSLDGKKIITISNDKTGKIWDTERGLLLANLKGHKDSVFKGNFSPNGETILTVSNDGTAKLWNAVSGMLVQNFGDKKNKVADADFSKDGKYIFALFADSTLKLFDVVSGQLKYKIKNTKDVNYSAAMNASNTQIATIGNDFNVRLWEVSSGKLLKVLKGHRGLINYIDYSPDGTKLISSSNDSTARVWTNSGLPLFVIKSPDGIMFSRFSPDNKKICTATFNNIITISDSNTGALLNKLDGQDGELTSIEFSPDGALLVSTYDQSAQIWDMNSGRTIRIINLPYGISKARFNNDGTKIVTALKNEVAVVWDINTEEEILDLDGHTYLSYNYNFSKDSKRMVSASDDGIARIWDENSKITNILIGHAEAINSAEFSNDGKWVITASNDSTIKIWDATNSKIIASFKDHLDNVTSATFSSDNLKIITTSKDSTSNLYTWNQSVGKFLLTKKVKNPLGVMGSAQFSADGQNFLTMAATSEETYLQLWDATTGNAKPAFSGIGSDIINDAQFSPDSKSIITCTIASGKNILHGPQIWDVKDGHLIKTISFSGVFDAAFAKYSPDGKKIVCISVDLDAYIIEASTYKIITKLNKLGDTPYGVEFSKDNQKLLMSFTDNSARIWDVNSGTEKNILRGHEDAVISAKYSPDGKFIVTSSMDNTFKRWTTEGKLLYTFFPIDNQFDYLVIDPFDRYDGTSEARKLLYFTCGTEVIELEQFEDLSWQPGLVPMILGTSKLPITAKKLSEIQICNNTPIVKQKGNSNGKYEFLVIPRSGGVGMVQLFINSKLRTEYPLDKLIKKADGYLLSVPVEELRPYFVSESANTVSVKATTLNGDMVSRGGVVETVADKKNNFVRPNIYIVSIGINQYKGEKLKLNYASTDAESFASALSASAINFLGKEHVFTYTFSTEKDNLNWPAKVNILKKLEELSQVAKADDILVLFFAGHGVLLSGKKSFFILTADASSFELNGVEKEVAISTDELNLWMRKIKANKQLLILDACNSGQALEDIQNQITRRDIPPDQVKALENLKDKTGIYILSASASGQSAFEASQFGQGLLTYSLLSGIKYGTGLIQDTLIDVTRWFNYASDNVREMAKSIGGRQEPQIVGNASFDVGIADKGVKEGIHITGKPKKIFSKSLLFTGDISLLVDDIELGADFDKELAIRSSMGKQSVLSFIGTYHNSDAYSIRGSYDIQGNSLTIKVHLIAQKKGVGTDIIKTGPLDQKDQLIKSVVDEVVLLIN
jgi:WD40 repeat protein